MTAVFLHTNQVLVWMKLAGIHIKETGVNNISARALKKLGYQLGHQ